MVILGKGHIGTWHPAWSSSSREKHLSGCNVALSEGSYKSFRFLWFALNTYCKNLKISSFLLNFHPAVSCECLYTVTQIFLCHMSVRLVLLLRGDFFQEKLTLGVYLAYLFLPHDFNLTSMLLAEVLSVPMLLTANRHHLTPACHPATRPRSPKTQIGVF